ncbi:MAG: ATP-binding domain-containing protein [Thermoleophilaceae bacterium]
MEALGWKVQSGRDVARLVPGPDNLSPVARMHPRSLLEEELKSTGEGKVFAALRDGLSDEWEVFHSASVVFRDHAAGAQDDESDFVLSHPEKGIVSLEVKGGGIECRYGEWYRLARGGGRERMRDPFTQAIDHRYELKRKLETVPEGGGREVFLVHHARGRAGQAARGKGEEVLFVCFNRALLEHLRRSESQARISFFTFHGLCTHLAGRAGVELSSYPKGEAPPEFFREELPHALLEATDTLGGLYDALIVDEAQDLHGDWLEALTTTLRDEDESSAWLFTDDNQRVYDAILDVPREYRPFDLTVNCRNTQAIHREVMKLYEGDVVPEVKGPPGREIELHPTDDPRRTVKGVLARLCGQEEIPPQDVVVLSSHGLARSEVARGGGGSYGFVPERGKLGKHVHFSSIRGFKGLEAPVVVLCELEDLDEESRDQQLYVALSRARNHCVVVAPKS